MTSFSSSREKIGLYFTSATQDGLSGSQKLLSQHNPLSYVLFRIFASHIANEAKLAASVFSVSGTLGGHSMNQSSLQVLVRIKHNGSAGKRGWLVILQRHKEIAEMFWQQYQEKVQALSTCALTPR